MTQLSDVDDRFDADDRFDVDDRWSAAGRGGPVVVASPATVPAVRAGLAGSADATGSADGTGRAGRAGTGGPVVVVLLRGPSVGAVDGRLDELVARAHGELHLLVSGPGSVAAAARLRWLVPDLAERSVRVLLPPTERREGVHLVRAAGARHPVVVGSRQHPRAPGTIEW